MSHIHVHQSELLITGSACKSILPPCSQTPGHIACCPPISLPVLGARTNQSARSGCKDQSVCPFWVQGPISLPVLGARLPDPWPTFLYFHCKQNRKLPCRTWVCFVSGLPASRKRLLWLPTKTMYFIVCKLHSSTHSYSCLIVKLWFVTMWLIIVVKSI